MPLIEGVGDEVTNFMVVMMVIIIGILSWWSTSITEQPVIRTVLILEPHNRHRAVGSVRTTAVTSAPVEDSDQLENHIVERRHSETVSDTASESHASNRTKLKTPNNTPPRDQDTDPDPAPGSSTQLVEASTSSSGSSDQAAETSSEHPMSDIQEDTSSNCPHSGKNELRRRRLQFFRDKHDVQRVEASQQGETTDQTVNNANVEDTSKSIDCLSEVVEVSKPASEEVCSNTHQLAQTASNDLNSSDELSCTKCPSHSDSPQCTCSHSVESDRNASKAESALPDVNDIRIRLKYLNDNQKLVQGKLQEPLGEFKRRHFALEMEGNKVVRLIFNGQVLHSDDQTLQNYGLFDNCVVHCLVHSRRTTAANADAALNPNNSEDIPGGGNVGGAPREWDLSQLLYIGLSGILTMAWILRFSNPNLFSATSTIALFGLTGVYIISVVGMYIPDPEGLRT